MSSAVTKKVDKFLRDCEHAIAISLYQTGQTGRMNVAFIRFSSAGEFGHKNKSRKSPSRFIKMKTNASRRKNLQHEKMLIENWETAFYGLADVYVDLKSLNLLLNVLKSFRLARVRA